MINNKAYEGLNKIVAIKASINFGLTTTLQKFFFSVIPVGLVSCVLLLIRPVVNNQEIQDINWIIGFSEGESCFFRIYL